MDTVALAKHLADGRFDDAAELLGSYTIPVVTERTEDFIVHDLAADGAEVLSGTFQPTGSQVLIDLESAFSMWGTSRGALLLYVGQPDEPGSRLYEEGAKPLEGVRYESVGSVSGDSPWAGTTSRRLVFDVDPGKPVTWQVLAAIIGPAATTPVDAPLLVRITPDGSRAFVTSPSNGTVTPVALGRPLFSYDRIRRPDDVGEPAIPTGPGASTVAVDDDHAVVVNTDDAGGSVTVIDCATLEVRHHIALSGALGVAVVPGRPEAVVGTSDGRVVVVDLVVGSTREATIPGLGRFRGVAVTPDGAAALVADADAGLLHRIALPDLRVETTTDVGETPWVVTVAPDDKVWVLGRNETTKGHLRHVDTVAGTVVQDLELPYPRPNDVAIVPTAGQTDELVRTAWTVYDDGYSEFYVAGPFTGLAHTWHTARFPDDDLGPTSIAVNDFGEIWVVRPSQDHLYKWPGGRLYIRPGIFFGEYCSVAVYGARSASC